MELHRFLGVKVEVDVAVERLVKEGSCAAKGEEIPVRFPTFSPHIPGSFLEAISSTAAAARRSRCHRLFFFVGETQFLWALSAEDKAETSWWHCEAGWCLLLPCVHFGILPLFSVSFSFRSLLCDHSRPEIARLLFLLGDISHPVQSGFVAWLAVK